MMVRALHSLSICVSTLCLYACTTTPPIYQAPSAALTLPPNVIVAEAPIATPTATPKPSVIAATTWQSETLTGRFSIQYVQHQQNQSLYGQFVWDRTQAHTGQLDLRTPFGQTIALVTLTPTGATLMLPQQAPRNAATADQLIEDALGFPLPVFGLTDWLYGRAVEGRPAQVLRDAQSRPMSLEQDGWHMQYQGYFDGVRRNGLAVKRLDLTRQIAGDPIEIRLVLDAPIEMARK